MTMCRRRFIWAVYSLALRAGEQWPVAVATELARCSLADLNDTLLAPSIFPAVDETTNKPTPQAIRQHGTAAAGNLSP